MGIPRYKLIKIKKTPILIILFADIQIVYFSINIVLSYNRIMCGLLEW